MPPVADFKYNQVIRTERGWGGHYILARRCRFRRNTLLEYKDQKIVVSTVGLCENSSSETGFQEVGVDRYFETMAFHANPEDTRYYDADVSNQVYFDSPWAIAELDADDEANLMHEEVVKELTCNLVLGKIPAYEPYKDEDYE